MPTQFQTGISSTIRMQTIEVMNSRCVVTTTNDCAGDQIAAASAQRRVRIRALCWAFAVSCRLSLEGRRQMPKSSWPASMGSRRRDQYRGAEANRRLRERLAPRDRSASRVSDSARPSNSQRLPRSDFLERKKQDAAQIERLTVRAFVAISTCRVQT